MSWVLLTAPHLPGTGGPLPGAGVLAGVGVGLAVMAGTGYALGRRTRPHTTTTTLGAAPTAAGRRERWVELVLTVTAAGIATAVSLNGMWRVFGDVLHLDGPGRVATAGFLELALVVSASAGPPQSLREHGSVGVDGAAVWVIAIVSAVVSAADAAGLAKAVRLAAPVLAAWLWERGLAADRRAVRARRPVVIAWRWTRERLAVRLGLADPIERATTDVDRARRLAALTRARLRLAVLETVRLPWPLAVVTVRPVRAAVATWRLQRHALAAVEHLHLGTDPGVPVTIRATVAAVVGLRAATAPAALTAASPWTVPVTQPVAGCSTARRWCPRHPMTMARLHRGPCRSPRSVGHRRAPGALRRVRPLGSMRSRRAAPGTCGSAPRTARNAARARR